mgnify:CR=1 FL=1
MRLYLFDDATADGWRPFALSRPVGELRHGVPLLRERIERWAGTEADGHLTRPWLARYHEAGAPPAVEPAELPADEPRLLVSSRLSPALEASFAPPDGPAVLEADGAPAGCWLPAGTGTPDREWLARPDAIPGAPALPVQGRLLEAPWELVARGPGRIARDVPALAPRSARRTPDDLPTGVHADGDAGLFLGEGVRIEAGACLDLREGPVWLDRGVEVRAGCRLAGPLYAGPGCRLLGGPLEALSAGPVCKLRGEVGGSILHGWVNKAHAGHLGHALLGPWVNLGASTVNSDLKNNYGPVRMGGPGGPVETGLTKMGCLLGDHVKTAIGTLLGTGTVAGTGANLFGPVRPPTWVPPFSWGAGPDAGRWREEAFLDTARTVMARRDVELGAGGRAWLADVWEEARRRAEEGRGP